MTVKPAVSSLLLLGSLLGACGEKKAPDSRAKDGSPDSSILRSPSRTALSHQSIVRLSRGVLADTLEVPVRIEPDERLSRQVVSPADGRIEAVYIRTPEQFVRAGERIALLYAPEIATAQREFLLLDSVKDAELYRAARSRLQGMGLTEDQIQSIRASRKPLERTPILSPRAGFVLGGEPGPVAFSGGMTGSGKTMGEAISDGPMSDEAMGNPPASPGSSMPPTTGSPALVSGRPVNRGSVLARINDLSRIAAVLTLPASFASRFRKGDSVHLVIASAGFQGMARLDFLEAQVADSSGNVNAFAYLPNREGTFKLGSLGQAHIAARPESAWVLPRRAVHFLGERAIVWSRSEKDTNIFTAQEVRIGRLGLEMVEIREGLSPGEAVAENASLLLDPDVVLDPIPLPARGDSESAGHQAHSETVAPDVDEHGTAAGSHPPAASEGQDEGHTGHGTGAAAASPGDHAGHASPTESLVLSSGQAALAGVRTTRVDSLLLGSTASYRAVARLDDRSRESIPARVEGRIEQDRVLRSGERVRQGQLLAYLVSEPLQAAQEEFLLVLRARKNLADPSLVRAQIQAARRRLEVMGMSQNQTGQLESRGIVFARLPILAPKEGVLIEVGVQPGQYVAAGTSLFTLGFSDRIWIETWLLAQEAQTYPEGTPALIHLQGMPGAPLAAKLDHIRRGTSEAGSVVLAHLAIPNPGNRILPGMEVTVTFQSPGRRVLGIPASALIRSSTSAIVWLEAEQNTYFPRMVRLGREGGGLFEVLDGLQAGEKVVTTGAYLLNSEWTLRKGAGKVHGGH